MQQRTTALLEISSNKSLSWGPGKKCELVPKLYLVAEIQRFKEIIWDSNCLKLSYVIPTQIIKLFTILTLVKKSFLIRMKNPKFEHNILLF